MLKDSRMGKKITGLPVTCFSLNEAIRQANLGPNVYFEVR